MASTDKIRMLGELAAERKGRQEKEVPRERGVKKKELSPERGIQTQRWARRFHDKEMLKERVLKRTRC